jgi:TonB family protein
MALETITRFLNNPVFRSPAGIMKVCIGISLLFHFGLLIGFQNFFPAWNSQELKTYNVEIIRPPTEDLDKEDLKGSSDSLDQGKDLSSADTQDTISLDTKDERYVQYAGVIKAKIAKNWDYPAEARLSLMEGEVTVLFSLVRDGSLTQIKIEKGSGYDILDKEVLRAIGASVPFPSFPGSVKVNRLNIKARFNYKLTSSKKAK